MKTTEPNQIKTKTRFASQLTRATCTSCYENGSKTDLFSRRMGISFEDEIQHKPLIHKPRQHPDYPQVKRISRNNTKYDPQHLNYQPLPLGQSKNQTQSWTATMCGANQRNRTKRLPCAEPINRTGKAHDFENPEMDGLQHLSLITNNIPRQWETQTITS